MKTAQELTLGQRACLTDIQQAISGIDAIAKELERIFGESESSIVIGGQEITQRQLYGYWAG